MRRSEGNKILQNTFKAYYSLPCSPLILETEGKCSHPCCFQVVIRFFCFLCCPLLIAQIRLDWAPLIHG